MGYQKPTPIQEYVIPQILMGKDVIACAQTGTGKTASFTLPIIDILNDAKPRARMPRALIITPTRELAQQITQHLTEQAQHTQMILAQLTGGTALDSQMKRLQKHHDILIATPGRLNDLMERGSIITIAIQICVIDEADMMLDMGFIDAVSKILNRLPQQKQTLLFSATMSEDIRRLAKRYLKTPKEIAITPPSTATKNVTHKLVKTAEKQKLAKLLGLMQTERITNAIIFCNRKKDIETLVRQLRRCHIKTTPLHGDMGQHKRYEILAAFKSHDITILIASNVMARGIDVKGLSHVINYDVPYAAEDYIHRAGRTGRAGKRGQSITFATPEEEKPLNAIKKLLQRNQIQFQHIESNGQEYQPHG